MLVDSFFVRSILFLLQNSLGVGVCACSHFSQMSRIRCWHSIDGVRGCVVPTGLFRVLNFVYGFAAC